MCIHSFFNELVFTQTSDKFDATFTTLNIEGWVSGSWRHMELGWGVKC